MKDIEEEEGMMLGLAWVWREKASDREVVAHKYCDPGGADNAEGWVLMVEVCFGPPHDPMTGDELAFVCEVCKGSVVPWEPFGASK